MNGWRTHLEETHVVLSRDGGSIVVVERCAPLRSFAAVRAERWPDHAALDLGPVTELVTPEGELAEMAGAHAADGEERTLVAIWGDSSFATIEARCAAVEQRPLFRREIAALAARVTLGLGYERRRRVRHAAPAGFARSDRGLVTRWTDPVHPGVALTVGAACPRSSAAPPFEERLILEAGLGAPQGSEDAANPHGLVGRIHWYQDDRRAVGLAALEDGAFLYHVRLDAPAADLPRHRGVLLRVLESCRPVPPLPVTKSAVSALAHWFA